MLRGAAPKLRPMSNHRREENGMEWFCENIGQKCSQCGNADVTWSRVGDKMVPLERIGTAYVLTPDNTATLVGTYQRHRCDPQQQTAYTNYIAEQRLFREARAADRNEHWEVAIPRDCPKCGAAPGMPCENLAKRKKGIITTTAWPHQERLPVAKRPTLDN